MRPPLHFRMPFAQKVAVHKVERERSVRVLHPGNAALRRAIEENVVSFPSQVPALSKQVRPDVQWRAVTLYFVQGWTMNDIAARFGLALSRVSLLLYEWSVRAFALGYIQVIDEDRFHNLVERSEAALRGRTGEIFPDLCPEAPVALAGVA